ncbi:MAG: NUDIX domain-containing protein, partial [Mycobacteriales bacterium]
MTPEDSPPAIANVALAAGVLFIDEQRRVMLVKPTYKPLWEIPGGYVEPGESPYDACVREVEEELGIRPAIGELLAIDWAPHPQQGDKMLFVFNGGQLSPQQHTQIRLQASELSEYRYVNEFEIPDMTIPRLARRISQALQARVKGETTYLER